MEKPRSLLIASALYLLLALAPNAGQAGPGCVSCGGDDVRMILNDIVVDTFKTLKKTQGDQAVIEIGGECKALDSGRLGRALMDAIDAHDIEVIRSPNDSSCPLKDDQNNCVEFLTDKKQKQLKVDIDRLFRHMTDYRHLRRQLIHEAYRMADEDDWLNQCSRDLENLAHAQAGVDQRTQELIGRLLKAYSEERKQTGSAPVSAAPVQPPQPGTQTKTAQGLSSASKISSGALLPIQQECQAALQKNQKEVDEVSQEVQRYVQWIISKMPKEKQVELARLRKQIQIADTAIQPLQKELDVASRRYQQSSWPQSRDIKKQMERIQAEIDVQDQSRRSAGSRLLEAGKRTVFSPIDGMGGEQDYLKELDFKLFQSYRSISTRGTELKITAAADKDQNFVLAEAKYRYGENSFSIRFGNAMGDSKEMAAWTALPQICREALEKPKMPQGQESRIPVVPVPEEDPAQFKALFPDSPKVGEIPFSSLTSASNLQRQATGVRQDTATVIKAQALGAPENPETGSSNSGSAQ